MLSVLGVAVFLRFVQLGSDSLWVDEGFSWDVSRKGIPDLIHQAVAADANPPLYYVALHFWIQLFGDSEFALRSLGALVGVALVYLVYDLGRLLGGTGVGLAAALFAALSDLFVHQAQEARAYSLFACLAALSYALLLRFLAQRTVPLALAYVAATTALLYTHVYALFVLLAQATFLAFEAIRGSEEWDVRRRELIRLGGLVGVPLALFVPWVVAVLAERFRKEITGARDATLGWLDKPQLHELPGTYSGYAGSKLGLAFVLAAGLAAAVLTIRRSKSGAKGRRAVVELSRRLLDDQRVALLVPWAVFPVVIPFAISELVTPVFQWK